MRAACALTRHHPCSFHPHEFLLATASADRTARVWDLETFALVTESALRFVLMHEALMTTFVALQLLLRVLVFAARSSLPTAPRCCAPAARACSATVGSPRACTTRLHCPGARPLTLPAATAACLARRCTPPAWPSGCWIWRAWLHLRRPRLRLQRLLPKQLRRHQRSCAAAPMQPQRQTPLTWHAAWRGSLPVQTAWSRRLQRAMTPPR